MPDEPCTRCGALLWGLVEAPGGLTLRCGECNQDQVPTALVLSGLVGLAAGAAGLLRPALRRARDLTRPGAPLATVDP